MSVNKLSWKQIQAWIGNAVDGKNKVTWIVTVGLCGLLLIGLSSMLSGGSEKAVVEETVLDVDAHTAILEERLETLVSAISGAGNVHVMVTLENGVEYVYANEEKSTSDHIEQEGERVSVSDDSQKTVVTVDAASGKEGLLVTQIQPTVRGVVVACDGAENEQVAHMVREAVKTALDITDKRVCVIPYTLEKG